MASTGETESVTKTCKSVFELISRDIGQNFKVIKRVEIETRTLTLVLGCEEKMMLHEEQKNLCLGVTDLSLSIYDVNAIV